MTSCKEAAKASAGKALEMISYISLASSEPTEKELEDMLNEARVQNKENQITGSLLYRDGTYIQVFEGPAEKTESLYNKILSDSRHHKVVTLFRRPTQKRYFKDWTMAFRPLSSQELRDAKGYAESLQLSREDPQDATTEILNWIKSLIADFNPPNSSPASS